MKVLFVAGRHAYGDPRRGDGYEYANMLPAISNLGHSVVHFESFDRVAYADFAALNGAFVDTVERERPDIIFCVLMGYELWTESLDLVRASGHCLVINWGTDDSWKYDQFARFLAPRVDCYATTSAVARDQALADGLDNCLLTQWAASDFLLAPPRPAMDCRYQVSFVGAAYGNRRRWIRALARHGIHVDCFGHGWPNGTIPTSEVHRVMRDSVVTLNFGDSGLHWRGVVPYRSRQIKARVFEVPGAGGFLLTEHVDGLDRYFRLNDEVVAFTSESDLVERITYFLANYAERDRIAQAGHERTRTEHTYTRRLTALFDEAWAMRERHPVGIVACTTFADLAERHRLTAGLRALRWLLRKPLQAVWGNDRGARAARRLLHELSWRIAGAKTYGAGGWPGRLFYRES